MKIEIKYNGKKYNNISDAITQSIIDSIKEQITINLKPFEDQIRKHDGSVTIEIPKNFKNSKIIFHNIPKELVDKITEYL